MIRLHSLSFFDPCPSHTRSIALMIGMILLVAGCDSATDTKAMPTSKDLMSVDVASSPQPSPRICEVNDTDVIATQCKPGETLVFLPQSWGNEQYPLVAAAIGCDLTKQVIFNNGGVVCTVKQPTAKAVVAETAPPKQTGPTATPKP